MFEIEDRYSGRMQRGQNYTKLAENTKKQKDG